MKKFLIVLLMPILSLAQGGQGFNMPTPAANPGFVVKGNIEGLKDSTEVSLTGGMDGKLVASAKVVKGSFTLKGKLANPQMFRVGFSGYAQVFDLFIYNDAVNISGNVNDINALKIKGSPTHEEFQLFTSQFNPYFETLRGKVSVINAEPASPKRDSLIQDFNKYRRLVLNAAEKFAKDKPSSPVSSLTLFAVMSLFESPLELEAVYTQLQPGARKNEFAKKIEDAIALQKVGSVGTQALEFTQKDVDGKPVSLASFRGKYVLVDFWASWCRPCRAENPNVVSAYQEFKNKNFTVLGVSLDQQKPNWVEAIKADNLTWTHVSDLQYWSNAVAQLYHITSIPANILIDPTGKIIARDVRGEDLQRTLKAVLK